MSNQLNIFGTIDFFKEDVPAAVKVCRHLMIRIGKTVLIAPC